MGSYFKFVGVLELIGSAFLIIWRAIELFAILQLATYAPGTVAVYAVILILIIVVTPALGILFFSYGNHLQMHQRARERREEELNRKRQMSKRH